VVAYMLNLADIVPGDFVLSERNIAEVQKRLPNRDGMTREHGLWDVKGKGDVANVACMKNCATDVKLASVFPESARNLHGDPAGQNRTLGSKVAAAEKPVDIAELAKSKACLGCHGIDKRIVGPAFKEIAARYKGEPGIQAKLAQKLRRGGSGVWGPMAMPPNPDLAESDAAALIQWVLGL
jgi:cytochrome c551/c552